MDEKSAKVRETIEGWTQTCRNLESSRIARYAIGTSAETTRLVFGPTHRSMRDMRAFFDLQLHDANKTEALSENLERYGREYDEALTFVTIVLLRMARDYLSNNLVATMAILAAKIKRAADWRRIGLEQSAA